MRDVAQLVPLRSELCFERRFAQPRLGFHRLVAQLLQMFLPETLVDVAMSRQFERVKADDLTEDFARIV